MIIQIWSFYLRKWKIQSPKLPVPIDNQGSFNLWKIKILLMFGIIDQEEIK